MKTLSNTGLVREIPGKVNLFLEVLSKRADGYHDIRTLFLSPANPRDRIVLRRREQAGVDIFCDHPEIPGGEGNICHKAALLFAKAAGITPSWSLCIEKTIPVAAGMGGGSADAAATLLLLNELEGKVLGKSQMLELAAGIGADVPFFLDPVPSVGEGIGDSLRAVPLGCDVPLVLVNPRFPVPVAWTYRNLNRVERPPAPDFPLLLEAMEGGDLEKIAAGAHNALGFAVLDKFPLVAMLRDALLEAGCLTALVSGSGPTVFGIAPPGEEAGIATTIRHRFADSVWVEASLGAKTK